MGVLEGMKLPEPPILAAGALGGPFCMYTVTPFRNSMTYAAQDASLSLGQIFRTVFASGFRSGWTGGVYPAIAACPQFVCLGPMFHLFQSVGGPVGGIVLAGFTETAVLYGAETKNGQLAINTAKPGQIPQARMASPFIPWGPGFMINGFRNVFAMLGMRVLADPISENVSKVAGKGPVVQVASDLLANCCSAGITMPMHMLYQYVVTSGPDLWDKPQSEKTQRMISFLREQYFPGGKLSSVIVRDLVLRSCYIGTAYTLYVNIERSAVAYWPK